MPVTVGSTAGGGTATINSSGGTGSVVIGNQTDSAVIGGGAGDQVANNVVF